jgi:hypothetical protein
MSLFRNKGYTTAFTSSGPVSVATPTTSNPLGRLTPAPKPSRGGGGGGSSTPAPAPVYSSSVLKKSFISKPSNLIFVGIFILFIATFFFKTIPTPVENIDGINNPNKFIYGGMYWTSVNYETSVENNIPLYYFSAFFIFLTASNTLLKKYEVYN